MEVEAAVCDDATLLVPTANSNPRGQRFLPWMCSVTLVVAGFGGRAAWTWTQGEGRMGSHDVIGRAGENSCTYDGEDCRFSRCCAKPGSRCYRKSEKWASCNETCSSHRQWHGHHHHGHWKVTDHHVWDCTDLTVVTSLAPTSPPSLPPSTPASMTYKIYEDKTDPELEVHTYPKTGDRQAFATPAPESVAAPTEARVNWIVR